ncbi:hypothetical protein J6590_061559, partial [Homalodisca vitripennis]
VSLITTACRLHKHNKQDRYHSVRCSQEKLAMFQTPVLCFPRAIPCEDLSKRLSGASG